MRIMTIEKTETAKNITKIQTPMCISVSVNMFMINAKLATNINHPKNKLPHLNFLFIFIPPLFFFYGGNAPIHLQFISALCPIR